MNRNSCDRPHYDFGFDKADGFWDFAFKIVRLPFNFVIFVIAIIMLPFILVANNMIEHIIKKK